MTTPVDIDLNLDPSGYISGLRASADQTAMFTGTLRSTAAALTPLQKTMEAVTPSRAMLAGQGLFIAQAAKTRRELSGVEATSAVTGVNVGKLTKSMRELAKEMPIGNTASRQVVMDITKLGISAEGSETKVGRLAESFVRLHGSTGEDVSALTQGMIQLSRTMDTGTSPERIENMADSLVEVTKATGTSAVGVLGFSKAIAPLADAAGLGQTAVFGISAAFSKMGEDGFAGAMAVNKVLNDLNSSVREGTPQMGVYAQMVGKTRAEFETLFNANPAEALTQITEAIAQAGPRAPVLLEQLGLEGTRTARAITGAVSSGDIRGSIETAVAGYGSGANQDASEAAFGGLTDSMARLRAATEQVADALGTPFLGAVTNLTDVIGAGASLTGNVLNLGPIQGLLKALSYTLGPFLIATKLLTPAVKALAGWQALTSGPVRAVSAGIGSVLPDRRDGTPNVFARFGRRQNELFEAGQPMGQGIFAPLNRNARAAGVGLGEAAVDRGLVRRGSGVAGSLWQAGRGAPVAGLFALANTYFSAVANSARNARLPADQRDMTVRARGPVWDRYFAATDDAKTRQDAGELDEAGYSKALKDANARLGADLKGLSGAAGQARSAMGAVGDVFRQTGRSLASLGGQAAMTGFGLKSLGLAATLGLAGAGVGIYGAIKQTREQDLAEQRDNTGIGDEYNAALGRAANASDTFAGRVRAASDTIAASNTTMANALQIDARDQQAARAVQDAPAREFSDNAAATTALLNAQQRSGAPLDPQQIGRLSLDLLNQYGRQQAQDILSNLDQGQGGLDVGGVRTALTEATTGLADESSRRTGFIAGVQDLLNPSAWAMTTLGFGDEGRGRINMLTDGAQQGVRDVVTTTGMVAAETEDKYGAAYAAQEQRRTIDQVVGAAYDTWQADPSNDAAFDVYNDLVTGFQQQLGMDNPGRGLSGQELNRAGGSATAAFALRDERVAEQFDIRRIPAQREQPMTEVGEASGAGGYVWDPKLDLQQNQAAEARWWKAHPEGPTEQGPADLRPEADDRVRLPSRTVQPELRDTYYLDMLREQARSSGTLERDATTGAMVTGNVLEQVFTRIGPQAETEANVAFQALLTNKAGDPGYQVGAPALAMQQFRDAGVSMSDLARSAAATVNAINSMADAGNQAAQALYALAMTQVQREGMYRGEAWQVGQMGDIGVAVASEPITNAPGLELNQQATAQVQQAEAATLSFVQQFLLRHREYQTGIERMNADFRKQQEWAEADHLRSMEYMREDYETAVERAEESFNRQRARSYRDFAKQMRRIGEDLGRALYNPYERIQVQPIWDGTNLLGNLEEQVAAAQEQLANLARLRSMGLSDAAISHLQLTRSENAQQADVLVDDLAERPDLIGRYNAGAAAMTAAGAGFRDDPANVDTRRMAEDFGVAMADQATDFGIAMDQMAADQERAISRGEAAYTTATERMLFQHTQVIERAAEDWKAAASILTSDLGELTSAFNKAMNDEFVDYQAITTKGLDGWYQNLLNIAGKWKSTLEGTNATLKFSIDFEEGGRQAGFDHTGYTDRNADGRQRRGTGEYDTGSRHSRARETSEHQARRGTGGAGSPEGGNGFASPVLGGVVTSGYGPRQAPVTAGGRRGSSDHKGIDFGVPVGTPVRAAWDGRVSRAAVAGDAGMLMVVDHGGGRTTRYAHLSDFTATVGQRVRAGQAIARSGNTGNSSGPHLHFETRVGGTPVNPATAANSWRFASGGVFVKGGAPRTWGEESDEMLLPLDNRGAAFLAQVMQRLTTPDSLAGVQTAGKATQVTYVTEHHVTDQSTRFEGAIHVTAQDPDALAEKLASRQRRQALTRPAAARR